jgi:hypothetical protein
MAVVSDSYETNGYKILLEKKKHVEMKKMEVGEEGKILKSDLKQKNLRL